MQTAPGTLSEGLRNDNCFSRNSSKKQHSDFCSATCSHYYSLTPLLPELWNQEKKEIDICHFNFYDRFSPFKPMGPVFKYTATTRQGRFCFFQVIASKALGDTPTTAEQCHFLPSSRLLELPCFACLCWSGFYCLNRNKTSLARGGGADAPKAATEIRKASEPTSSLNQTFWKLDQIETIVLCVRVRACLCVCSRAHFCACVHV